MDAVREGVDARFRAIAAEYAPALVRLARGYEADEQRQQDLVQDTRSDSRATKSQ